MITVRVRYFASLRETLGSSEDVMLEPGSTVGDLRGALTAKDSVYAEVLATRRPVRSALDHVMCDEQAVLQDGSEVAFFPPVTGG
jgi:molybdopterin synthase sulfur carrier subunit